MTPQNTQTAAPPAPDGDHQGADIHPVQGLRRAFMKTFLQSSLAPATASDVPRQDSTGGGEAEILRDLREFHHALFRALRSESLSTPADDEDPLSPASTLQNAFSALIAELGNDADPGNPAVSALRDAFAELVEGIQEVQGPEGASQNPPILEDFVAALQQNVSNLPDPFQSTGNLVDVSA